MNADKQRLISSAEEFLAAIPYLLGFHPTDSLVIVGLDGGLIAFAARYDLESGEEETRARADEAAAWVDRQGVGHAALVGYGTAARVEPALHRTGDSLRYRRVAVAGQFRVDRDRFWPYHCSDVACCPPDGIPCRPETTVMAASSTYAGQVVLPDRHALVARVASVEGAERYAMTAATARARVRLAEALPRGIRAPGRAAVRAAEVRYRGGRTFTDDEVAWLGMMLVDLKVRDYAWGRSSGEQWRPELWCDVLRRVDPLYAPAPASLLAFAAWQRGSGALAAVAIDRALHADPHYSFAKLMDDILRRGVPASLLADDWARMGGSRPPRRRRRGGRTSGRAQGRAVS